MRSERWEVRGENEVQGWGREDEGTRLRNEERVSRFTVGEPRRLDGLNLKTRQPLR